MRNLLTRLLCTVCALLCPALVWAQAGNFQSIAISGAGRPLSGVSVAICSGLATTGAAVASNTATLTMASNPITAGFLLSGSITVYGFQGADAYFNGTFTISSLSSTQIQFALTHVNASASSNGATVQQGATSGTACLPLASTFTDATASVAGTNPFVTDGLGNVNFFASPGVYEMQYYGASVSTTMKQVVINCAPASAAVNCGILANQNNTLTGINTASDLNGGKYVDGTKYATLAAAFAACPGTGCVIDMRGNPSVLALGTFDPGTTPVTLLLGPYAYTAVQFTLRNGFRVEGSGGLTTITSVGSNATPLLVIPQVNGVAAQHVYMKGIVFAGASANTSQDGLFADASTLTNAGLWYSHFEDLIFSGFKGSGIHLKGPLNSFPAGNQFDQFVNCIVFGPSGRQNSLRIEGGNNQIDFYSGQYDGSGIADGGTNIYVGFSGVNSQQPSTINFYDVTTQSTNVGVNVNGCNQCGFFGTHMESLNGGFNITYTGSGTRNNGVTIEHTAFFGTVGVNAGSGYLVNVATGFANVVFKHNAILSGPDKIVAAANLSTVSMSDNHFSVTAPYPTTTSGVTLQLTAAATIDIGGSHSVDLNASGTAVSTINSMLGPGESITFRSLGNTVSFATGGNLGLGSNASPIVLSSGDTATFVREDGFAAWNLAGYSRGTNSLPASTTIGGGQAIAKVLLGTGTLTYTAIAANLCQEQPLAVTGATANTGAWAASPNPGLGNVNLSFSAHADSVNNSVLVRVCNPTVGSITPTAVSWTAVGVQ